MTAPAVTRNKLAEQTLVIATHNPGKLAEFKALLAPYFSDVVSAATLDLPEPEETGVTFMENALLKAHASATLAGHASLADDSGLCVTALKGAPGVYSGRYAEVNGKRDFSYAMQRIHRELGDETDRSAEFVCVLALVVNDHTEIFEGRLKGSIIWPPRGSFGHGYDPFFVPDGHNRTYAEMTADEKNALSHRAIATQKLLTWLRQDV